MLRNRLRGLLAIVALLLAFLLVWQKVHIIFFVRLSWIGLVAMILVFAAIIYLVLDFIRDRLGL